MAEIRFAFHQISLATGIDVQLLERRRRQRGMTWKKDGYTLDEVKEMINPYTPIKKEEVDHCRSVKAKELYTLLNE